MDRRLGTVICEVVRGSCLYRSDRLLETFHQDFAVRRRTWEGSEAGALQAVPEGRTPRLQQLLSVWEQHYASAPEPEIIGQARTLLAA